MSSGPDVRVPGFLGRVLDSQGAPVGTCFQISPGVLATAWHALLDAGAVAVGDIVSVDGIPLGGAPSKPATVIAVDAGHDLAVLTRSVPLPGSISDLEAATDTQTIGTPILVTGHVLIPGIARRFLDAAGTWAGATMREDSIPLGRLASSDVMLGMSGAPVLRQGSDTVIGVVSARYNTSDGWLPISVWGARIEDLAPSWRMSPPLS